MCFNGIQAATCSKEKRANDEFKTITWNQDPGPLSVRTMGVTSFKHPISTAMACPTIGTSFSGVGPVWEARGTGRRWKE